MVRLECMSFVDGPFGMYSSMVRLDCQRGGHGRARDVARARRRSSRSFSFMSKRTGLFERCDSAKDVSRTRVYTMHVCADVRLRMGPCAHTRRSATAFVGDYLLIKSGHVPLK